jgi:hypothetical protein
MKHETSLALQQRGEVVALDLDTILTMVGADRWSEETIAAHKAAELSKAPPPSWMWEKRYLFREVSDVVQGASIVGAVLAVCSALVCAVLLLFGGSTGMPALISIGTAAAFVALVYGFEKLQFVKVRSAAKWILEDVEGQAMPVRAHELIASITSLAPRSTFKLQKLVQGKDALDPILQVSLRNPLTRETEERAILVWDAEGNIVPPPV